MAIPVVAALFLTSCGSSDDGCSGGKQPGLFLSVQPKQAQANGTDAINVTISGRDSSCRSLPVGVQIDLGLDERQVANTGDDPNDLGRFTNGEDQISVNTTSVGASTELTSTVAGTVKITATADVEGETLTAAPVEVAFTEEAQNRCAIEAAAAPTVIPGDGQSTSTITASVVNYAGQPAQDGTQVTFSTTLGQFVSSQQTTATASTSGGEAQVRLRSAQLADSATASVTASFLCDDSHSSERSDGTNVRFSVGANEPYIELSASSLQVLADDTSTASLTAEVFQADGTPVGAGEAVNFLTNLGRFLEAEGTADPQSYDTTTDSEGKAYATFVGGAVGGSATVQASATVQGTDISDEKLLTVRQVGEVEFVGADPDKLGIRGSGRNETSIITFRVDDTNGQPFPDLLIQFTISTAPGNPSVEPIQARTNDNGLVTTSLKAGTAPTTVTVTATAEVGQVSMHGESPALAIVGAKPSARSMSFACERFNVGGFILIDVHTRCTVLLADRYNNKVGLATQVHFFSEAGQIDPVALTEDEGENMGRAQITIRTAANQPKDVDPLPGEPFIFADPYTRNPRDGLLTLVAVTTGEEQFDDTNGNGQYDDGEHFIDLGEPFVDKDDDGVRDPDEIFSDSNDNGEYDGPNNAWDGDTLIWKPYWMLWTGEYAAGPNCGAAHRYSGMCPRTFDIPNPGSQLVSWRVSDGNLNPLNESTRVSLEKEGQGGEITMENPSLPYDAPDTLGMAISMVQVSRDDPDTVCNDTHIICILVPEIGGFSGGLGGTFYLVNENSGNAATNGTVSITVDYWQSPGKGANLTASDSIGGTYQPPSQ